MALAPEEYEILVALLRDCRWSCLATSNSDGTPHAAMVAWAPDTAGGELLMHLSTLSRHTRNLLARPAVSLAVGEPHTGQPDPQTLARVSIQGAATQVARDDPVYARLRAAYLAALPEAAPRFDFGDFLLLRVAPARAHYVGGFARAFAVDGDTLRAALCRAAAAGD